MTKDQLVDALIELCATFGDRADALKIQSHENPEDSVSLFGKSIGYQRARTELAELVNKHRYNS